MRSATGDGGQKSDRDRFALANATISVNANEVAVESGAGCLRGGWTMEISPLSVARRSFGPAPITNGGE